MRGVLAILLIVGTFAGKGSPSHVVVYVFLSWVIGWLSATIARVVYPPHKKRRSGELHPSTQPFTPQRAVATTPNGGSASRARSHKTEPTAQPDGGDGRKGRLIEDVLPRVRRPPTGPVERKPHRPRRPRPERSRRRRSPTRRSSRTLRTPPNRRCTRSRTAGTTMSLVAMRERSPSTRRGRPAAGTTNA
jgi:hypothetical protein